MKAEQLKRRLADGEKLPFKDVVSCNVGNPHDMGQAPITFFRQVLAACHCPELLEVPNLFSDDVRARARKYLADMKGGTGAYTQSKGIDAVRKEVADFISARDGVEALPHNIFLTDGASAGIKMIIQSLIRTRHDGIMIPTPQYPLYSASISLFGGTRVPYFLTEEDAWSLSTEELERSLEIAKNLGIRVRGLAVINPGNPTGNCMTQENIQDVIRFCQKHELLIMADEVYQTNIYGEVPFTSFRKALAELGPEFNDVELASFHSVSKGFVGECGQRGGYMELTNFDEGAILELYKLASIGLCSNVSGQIMTGLMVNPPKPGEPGFELYNAESQGIFESLKRRAKQVAARLNELEGVECNEVAGALYAFPSISIPEKAIVHAATHHYSSPCALYCMRLLNATGVCVIPGAGFGQKKGTYHFRTTILPAEAVLESVMDRVSEFHQQFMEEFRD